MSPDPIDDGPPLTSDEEKIIAGQLEGRISTTTSRQALLVYREIVALLTGPT